MFQAFNAKAAYHCLFLLHLDEQCTGQHLTDTGQLIITKTPSKTVKLSLSQYIPVLTLYMIQSFLHHFFWMFRNEILYSINKCNSSLLLKI
jgi:hypothetical protein